MPADEHLGPQFFHGTDAELEPGAVLRPGKEVGKNNWGNEEASGHHVWMLTDPDYASAYGRHVYEVKPEGWTVNFSEESGHTEEMESSKEWEWITPRARVIRKHA